MIEAAVKIKCASCQEFGDITKHSRMFSTTMYGVTISRVEPADYINTKEDDHFLCSLGCLIKFIASEADNDRL